MTSTPTPSTTSRRTALKSLVLGALVAGVAGAVARVRLGGYSVSRRKPLASLVPWELAVVEHAARRIAAPDRPGDPTIPSPEDVDVAGFVDDYAARMSPPMRRDLSRALLYLEQLAPVAVGLTARFTHLDAEGQDRALRGLEASPLPLLRGAFAGLKSLVFMGYYRDPRTWRILGYDGPWVRPSGGDAGRARP